MSAKKQTKREARLVAVRSYLDRNYDMGEALRYDVLSRKVQTLSIDPTQSDRKGAFWRDMTDRDINTIASECAEETGLNIAAQDVHMLLHSEYVREVHPLRDYLDRCPAYTPDMPDWIDELAQQVQAHSQDLWRQCFKKWFVGMVAGWMRDEVVNHQVLVLVGRQGIYKTTWLEHLIPPELRQYSCKMASSRELSKDDRIRIAEFGLISLDEIDAMSPRELNVLKSVITTTDVNERAAYGYTKERRIRCATFCASGNNRQFLTDDTGNRRWLPFEVESIENPWGRQEPWKWIYGQAKHLVEMGYNYWFDLDENDEMEEHKQQFEMPHNEEELLSAYFRPAGPEDACNAHFYSASEIHGRLITWGSIKSPMPLNRFGNLLRAKGYEMKRTHSHRGFLVVERSETERTQDAREIATSDSESQ